MAFNPVKLSQRDPKWKDEKLGSSTLTLGSSGCALTSVAMLLSGYGYNETPGSLNKDLKSHGGFVGAAIVWGAVSALYPKVKFSNIIICRDSDAPLAAIDASIVTGKPVLVEVDSSPAAGLQTHWVVLYATKGGDYLMLDPWPLPSDAGEALLTPRYSQGKSLKRTISAAVWYDVQGSGTPVTPPPSNTPSTVGASMVVRVQDGLDSGLRLRSEPTTSAVTVELELSGTLLAVLEPLDVANAKVGQYNQWLKVRDPRGREGYVAAWYVDRAEIVKRAPTTPETPTAPPPAPKEETPSTPAETGPTRALTVYVSKTVGDSGLRLRSEPSAGGALIKVLRAGRALTVLEAADDAKPKIGKQGAWLNVRDPENSTGYVAGWLVTLEAGGGSAPGPTTTTPTTTSSTSTTTPPASTPTPGLIVSVLPSVGSSGLRMRSQPSPAGALVTIVPAGHQLSVLEPEAQARAKIGVNNQWLSARDATGKTGYVAAWYVQEVEPITAAAETAGENLAFSIDAPAKAVETLTVHVAGLPSSRGGLYLRATPATDGQIVRLLPAYLPLEVLEDLEAAEQKIGVFNEWLHVREPAGGEGYVAAWFVTR
jgi:SH3 domain-containing protein/peptidase C39-like protein